jgi:DNA-binding protein Fis
MKNMVEQIKNGGMIIAAIDQYIADLGRLGSESQVYDRVMTATEKVLINRVLMRVKNNKSEAAKILGISRTTLRRKIEGCSKQT